MMRDRRFGHSQECRQVTDTHLPVAQRRDNSKSGGIAQDLENGGQPAGLFIGQFGTTRLADAVEMNVPDMA